MNLRTRILSVLLVVVFCTSVFAGHTIPDKIGDIKLNYYVPSHLIKEGEKFEKEECDYEAIYYREAPEKEINFLGIALSEVKCVAYNGKVSKISGVARNVTQKEAMDKFKEGMSGGIVFTGKVLETRNISLRVNSQEGKTVVELISLIWDCHEYY